MWNENKKYIPHCRDSKKRQQLYPQHTQAHDLSLSLVGTDTPINTLYVLLVLWSQISSLPEMIEMPPSLCLKHSMCIFTKISAFGNLEFNIAFWSSRT